MQNLISIYKKIISKIKISKIKISEITAQVDISKM